MTPAMTKIEHDMLAALERVIANVERWLETGEAATPDESKSIYEQMVAARDAALQEQEQG